MKTPSKAAEKIWRIGNNHFYFNLVEKAVPQILQSSAKKLKVQNTELFKAIKIL